MKYYISCISADHGKIAALSGALESIGHACIFDWWNTSRKRKKENFEIAFQRVQAIENAELFICLLPVSITSAAEIGVALASRYGKRIILWSADSAFFDSEFANIYYNHPSVTQLSCSFEELLEYVRSL